MKKLIWSQLTEAEKTEALARPLPPQVDRKASVAVMIASVRAGGAEVIRDLTQRYDGARLESFEVSAPEREQARKQVSAEAIQAMERAAQQITAFHRAQLPKDIQLEVSPQIQCERRFIPLQSIGLYIPGGTAPLPSTVLMLGVPAKLAGCPQITLCTPPRADGSVEPHILEAARLCGITRIFKIGGVQAIAAMAYGIAGVPKADKIFGPGNGWVTEAKSQVASDPAGAAIDMPAGPSEVMVIADKSARIPWVSWDLLSQAEHGPDSQVLLVTTEESLGDSVLEYIETEALPQLPRRAIATEALGHSRAIVVTDLSEAFTIANRYAPEHLIVQTERAGDCRGQILNAGSVFLGPWSPESAGDYASGTNHVLPTYGYARAWSGLSMDSFFKSITFQQLGEKGLRDIAPAIEKLATLEGLEAHRRAVAIRLESGGAQ